MFKEHILMHHVRNESIQFCGDEFGIEFRGCIAVIVKALYGLKTSAFAWQSYLAATLWDLGYE
jgi:hypothetical protein